MDLFSVGFGNSEGFAVIAARYSHNEICKRMIGLEMDPFIADEQGKNAVNYAIENNDFPLLEVFHQFWTKFIKLENL